MSDESSILAQLEVVAAKHGHVLYSILKRNAGWGVHWFVEARIPVRILTDAAQGAPFGLGLTPNDWQQGLVVYGYHPTFNSMVFAELARFRDIEERMKGDAQ